MYLKDVTLVSENKNLSSEPASQATNMLNKLRVTILSRQALYRPITFRCPLFSLARVPSEVHYILKLNETVMKYYLRGGDED